MRDDRNRWPEALGQSRPDLSGAEVTVRVVPLGRQTVLSGPFPACMKLAGLSGDAAGTSDIVTAEHYAVRQRRDRILVVGGSEIEDGWNNDAGVAVSDLSAAHVVIEVSGANAERIIATGTEFSAKKPGRSAARLWHSFTCLIYRHKAADTYRFHRDLDGYDDFIRNRLHAIGGIASIDTSICYSIVKDTAVFPDL